MKKSRWKKQRLTLKVLKARVEIVLEQLDALVALSNEGTAMHYNFCKICESLREAIR